jgi:hypothetical protein
MPPQRSPWRSGHAQGDFHSPPKILQNPSARVHPNPSSSQSNPSSTCSPRSLKLSSGQRPSPPSPHCDEVEFDLDPCLWCSSAKPVGGLPGRKLLSARDFVEDDVGCALDLKGVRCGPAPSPCSSVAAPPVKHCRSFVEVLRSSVPSPSCPAAVGGRVPRRRGKVRFQPLLCSVALPSLFGGPSRPLRGLGPFLSGSRPRYLKVV